MTGSLSYSGIKEAGMLLDTLVGEEDCSGMDQTSFKTLQCDCLCFQKELFNYPENFEDDNPEQHIAFWQKYLENLQIEICKHRAKSIFNLPCGHKTCISSGVYEASLNHALSSLELLENTVKSLHTEDEIVYVSIKFNPLPKNAFISIMKNFLLMEKNLIIYSNISEETFAFEYYARYFVIHKQILSILETSILKNGRQAIEALVSELEKIAGASF